MSLPIPLRPATGMSLPELETGHPVRHVVSTMLRKRRGPAPFGAGAHAHWDAPFFGLHRVTLFCEATAEEQNAILERCGRDLLTEALFIEKAGVGYAAKMVLLAETIDERKLYALFGADEAIHLDGISRFCRAPVVEPADNPFLALLSALIEDGDRQSLQAIIQVVLEGWGLTHYRALREGCTSLELRKVLGAILTDEAAHHGSGVVLVGDSALPAASTERIHDTMTRFLAMVQAGPVAVYQAVAAVRGPLDEAERHRLWLELDPLRGSAMRLLHLKELMNKTRALAGVTERLDAAGAFEPRCTTEPA